MNNIRIDIQESELPIDCNIVDFSTISPKDQEMILEDAITWYK